MRLNKAKPGLGADSDLPPAVRWTLGLVLALAMLACGCTEEPSSPPTFGTGALTAPPSSAQTTQAPQAANAEPAVFVQVCSATVSAVQKLGPVRVSIRETWNWQLADSEAAPEGERTGSESAQVEELLDPSTQRARLTVSSSRGAAETTVVDGKVRTTVSRTGPEAEGGVTTYRQVISLEPPVGLPLPLWAGSAFSGEEGYLGLMDDAQTSSGLASAASRGQAWRLADGSYVLTWERAGDELKEEGEMKPTHVAWRLNLSPDFLPLRLEVRAKVDVEGIMVASTGALDYTFAAAPPLAMKDVALEVPPDWSEKTITRVLPLDWPLDAQADWGQYWLGTELRLAGAPPVDLTLQEAQYRSYEFRNLVRGPEVVESDRSVELSYLPAKTARENKSPQEAGGIEVSVRSPSAPAAKDARQYAEQQTAAGRWQRQQAKTAGQKATVYLGSWETPPEGQPVPRINMISVSLPDAWVQVQLFLSANVDEVLAALSRLTPAGSAP